ncbi:extensin-like [Punica granatum]|uniref:Extensin-like n=1 Tax=Punica granatum TaxID=22663 RepID=A0A6P8DFQ3_PUNGR|nr:extensin-like [Punica granatum]
MAEGDRVDIFEEVNPPVPAHSQPPPMHAPPPPTPTGILPAYSGAPPTHLPPPTSSGAPLPPVSLTSSSSDDQARITALEGTANQMASNMAELLALLRGPNRASSSSTPPPGQGPTVDPTPRVPPTQAPENMDAPAPPTLHASMAHPFTSPYPPPPGPTAVPLPPATFLSSEQALSAPPPISIPVPAAAYTAPPPMVFPASSAPALTHPQAAELPPYPSLQPHVGLSYQAPPPINTTFHEPGTPTHAAQFASPTHFFPDADVE